MTAITVIINATFTNPLSDVAVTYMGNHLRNNSMFGQDELRPASIEVSMPGGHHAIFRYDVGVEVDYIPRYLEFGLHGILTVLHKVLTITTRNPNSGLQGQKWTLKATKRTDPTLIIIVAIFTEALTDEEKELIINQLPFEHEPYPIEIDLPLEYRAEFTFRVAEKDTPPMAFERAVGLALGKARKQHQNNIFNHLRTLTYDGAPEEGFVAWAWRS
jgi:hypothetical protein